MFRALRAFFTSPRFAAVRFVLAAFLLWRGALFLLDFATVYSLPERSPNGNKDYAAFLDSRFWDSFARWDSGWYNRIVARGYYFEGGQSNVAFFPAYPYLSRWLGAVVGSPWAAGLILSNLTLLGGLFFLYGIARRYLDEAGSRRAVLFALAFPSSFFFSAFYTESLFFFTVAGSFYFYERDRLLPAGLFGAFAALTRSTGILLLPALLLGALHRRGWRPRNLTPRLLWLLWIPAGLATFMLILWVQVGDPLAFMKAQAGWGRNAAFPLTAIVNEAKAVDWTFPRPDYSQIFLVFDLVATLGLCAVLGASLRRLDLGHAVFALLSVAFPLASGRVLSMTRFAACMLPMYLILAMVSKRRGVEQFLLYAMALFLALHTISFSNWYWAG